MAAASQSQSQPVRADQVMMNNNNKCFLLFGLPPDARPEEIEYVLHDVQRTLSRLDSKRGTLQAQIAAAAPRGKRRAPPGIPAAAAVDDPAGVRYTRKQVRRRLRAAAGDVKKERKRLEAVWGDLEEALVDARERRLPLHLQPGA